MVELDGNGTAFKCDVCDGDPACVNECPADALLFTQGDSELVRMKAAQMKCRTTSGSPGDKRRAMAEIMMKKARA
jgi:Fe-S-cluster-containing hydrogenase component 2